ncbi:putative receptor-like protein kinase [Vitis vinifera]|uniref:Putative receptor-like protein kinase n=1 Tax=Vitis vinifera TaxID=29760 RepID=A0A438JQG7_VITVI|nr:putative receptor-like protein kinase [Vitis vinifera]
MGKLVELLGKASIIAVSSVVALIILIIVARVSLKLSNTFFLILGADIAAILAIFTYVIIRWRFNRRRKLYKELEEATDNFQALIGRGASASVFRGILNDGTSVAVKRIEGEEHGEKEFKSEVAAIASVQHVNLVRLLGYCCVPGGPRFLIYDFIQNGSLDWLDFPSEGKSRRQGCLSWDFRYRVALDVAKALSYLHHDCRALVSDFGLSKLMRKDESRVLTTIRGTRGYLAPEWLLEHGVSEKSDIYSYGMVLFEMLGGQRNVCLIENGNDRSQRKWQYFPKVVTEKMREGKLMEVVDHRLVEGGGHVTVDEPPETQMIIVDLLCTDEEPANACNRPRMAALVTPQVDNATLPSTSTYSYALSVLSGR